MSGRQRGLILLLAAGVASELLVPPYFAMDTTSADGVHASLGHHPVWRPPSTEAALPALSALPAAHGRDVRAEDLVIRLNVVRIVMEALGLAVAGAVGLRVSRRQPP